MNREQANAVQSIRRAIRSVGKGLSTPSNPSFSFPASCEAAQADRDRNQRIRRGSL